MRRRPDVVISLEFGFRTLQAMLYRIFIPSSRLIVWVAVSERTEQGRGVIRRMLRQLIIKHADAFLVNGHSGRRYLMRFKVPKKRIFLVPPASDMEPFGNTSIERPQEIAYRLIYVGQLIERKGINLFLQVLCQWAIVHPDRRIEFWLAGEGPIRKELEVRTLPKNIFLLFLGNIDYDDLSQVYAKAGIFVFPTLADDWGMVVNEAMAAGLPVLGSIQSQAVEDLVQDGTNGWLFDPENPKDTFRALEKALETPFYVLETMRQKSRQTAMKITPLTMVEQIVHSINYCLSLS
jgi:glycosyltransferase involved in cell wall biosynthesis